MENLKIFEYNDMPISFITNDDGEPMVNATEMAKAFGKNIKHWFSNQSTIDYIKSYVELKGIKVMGGIPPITYNKTSLSKSYPSLIGVIKGNFSDNRKQGTFLCRGLSIEFARWLSPSFAIWCDERILEYLQLGFTASDDVLLQMQSDPDFAKKMAEELTVEREKNRVLEEHNTQLLTEAEENRPKVNFYENIQEVNRKAKKQKTYTITKVGSRLKANPQYLNKLLINNKVIVRVENGFDVHPDYADANIAYPKLLALKPKHEESDEYDSYDEIATHQQYLTYTEAGVELINNLLMQNPPPKKK